MPDSSDIAEQMEDDINLNGIADYCDPDAVVRWENNQFEGAWQNQRNTPGTSYYRVRHGEFGVIIRYTVPPGGARVVLEVLDAQKRRVTVLHAARDTSGAYELDWDKTSGSDDEVAPGLYTFRLRVGKRTYLQRQRWIY